MNFDDMKDYLAKDWEHFRDRLETLKEEAIDISLDQWDTIKRADKRIVGGVAGGAALLIVILLLLIFSGGPEVPVIAKRDLSGALGMNFISIINTSEEPLDEVYIVLNNQYIYEIDQLGPLQELILKTDEFYHKSGAKGLGEPVDEDFEPQTLKILYGAEVKVIDLTGREPTFFEKLFGQ